MRRSSKRRLLILLSKARKTPFPAVGTRPIFPRTRFVDIQRATIEFVAIERAHRSFSLRFVVHSDEREAARLTSHPVHHEMDLIDGAVFFEQILEIVLGGLKREITYVQFHCVLNMEKLLSYRAVPGNRVSNHQ